METQKFKGDDTELKMEAAAKPAFDLCGVALDEFFESGYTAADFLLMLYDEGRMPFSDRVPRDSFVAFFREAVDRFQFTGTFDTYLFIIESIFGEGSGVLFEVPGPGQIDMIVNAASTTVWDLVAKEFIEGEYEVNNLVTSDGDSLETRGIAGIDSEYELQQLLAELIPAGIFPDITLTFYALYNFVEDDGIGGFNDVIDHLGNRIVFIEN